MRQGGKEGRKEEDERVRGWGLGDSNLDTCSTIKRLTGCVDCACHFRCRGRVVQWRNRSTLAAVVLLGAYFFEHVKDIWRGRANNVFRTREIQIISRATTHRSKYWNIFVCCENISGLLCHEAEVNFNNQKKNLEAFFPLSLAPILLSTTSLLLASTRVLRPWMMAVRPQLSWETMSRT
jgi:hypothetical protein